MPERLYGPYNVGEAVFQVIPRNKMMSDLSDLPHKGQFSIWKKRPYSHELVLAKMFLGLKEGPMNFDVPYFESVELIFRWIYSLQEKDFVNRGDRIAPLFLNPDFKAMLRRQIKFIKTTYDEELIRKELDIFLTFTTKEMMFMAVLNSDFDPTATGHAVA